MSTTSAGDSPPLPMPTLLLLSCWDTQTQQRGQLAFCYQDYHIVIELCHYNIVIRAACYYFLKHLKSTAIQNVTELDVTLATACHVASSPGHSHVFNVTCTRRKEGGPGTYAKARDRFAPRGRLN